MPQGGFIPDIVLWLSYFYTSRELPIRLSFFWTTLSVTSIVTSLLAFALLHLRGVNGWGGWRWLFLVEDPLPHARSESYHSFTCRLGGRDKELVPPNGWFTDRETIIVVNRVLRDDPSKGDMHNRRSNHPEALVGSAKGLRSLATVCYWDRSIHSPDAAGSTSR